MKEIHPNISQKAQEAKSRYRDRVDLLRSRLDMLSGRDKVLMTMYLENGNSFRQMARLSGINETSIARRIHKLTEQLIDSEYITCLRNRNKFTGRQMAIARDYFLRGLSIKRIAAKRHSTYYRVQQTLKRIQDILKNSK
jgi:predicted DNA-binding protein YlxM (UPF0122 family)